MHKWGIPILHVILWTVGLIITTDFLGIVKTYFSEKEFAVSVGAVIVIFLFEIVLTFVDVVQEKKTEVLDINFCYYVAFLVATIIISVVVLFLGCHFLPSDKEIGMSFIGIMIFVTAFTKGMETWLQNNWSVYFVDVASKNTILHYSA